MTPITYEFIWTLCIVISLITIVFFLACIPLAIESHRKSVITGEEGLIGVEGTVFKVGPIHYVRLLGEIWEATSEYPLKPRQKIKVKRVSGLLLQVEPVKIKKHAPGVKK